MLSSDSGRIKKSVCLVIGDEWGLTVDSCPLRDFIQAGWTTHVLACGSSNSHKASCTPAGIAATTLDKCGVPDDFRVTELYRPVLPERADRVRLALEQLHRERGFGVIEFASRHGLGVRAIQAKRAGLAFHDTILAVRLDGNSQRDRESKDRWPGCFAEVEADYMERVAFEQADAQCMTDQTLAAFVRQNGWQIQPTAITSVAEYEYASHLATSAPGIAEPPLVTVGITHHNLGRYLPDTLASIAAQTYPNMDVIVLDDGSTDAASVEVFEAMRERYPTFRFVQQANAGVAAARNQCLALARGEYYVSVDADNIARPDMIAKFVTAIQRNPELAAMTCYLLAFDTESPNGQPHSFRYAIRPLGGPHALAGIRNVYGDANAIHRTSALRAVGGCEIDRGTATEDWEVFVKLVHAGYRVGVVPEHLFYYRHRSGSYTRTSNWFANHQRVLRQFAHAKNLSPAESLTLWTALLGFHQRLEEYDRAVPPRRHQLADRVHSLVKKPLRWMSRKLGLM